MTKPPDGGKTSTPAADDPAVEGSIDRVDFGDPEVVRWVARG